MALVEEKVLWRVFQCFNALDYDFVIGTDSTIKPNKSWMHFVLFFTYCLKWVLAILTTAYLFIKTEHGTLKIIYLANVVEGLISIILSVKMHEERSKFTRLTKDLKNVTTRNTKRYRVFFYLFNSI